MNTDEQARAATGDAYVFGTEPHSAIDIVVWTGPDASENSIREANIDPERL
jgi:hypothetical protein